MSCSEFDLDALLKESLKSSLRRRQRGKGAIKRLKAVGNAIASVFRNPDNWETRRVLSLIHISPSGEETSIGLFQESVHRQTGARKLLRVPEGDCQGTEYVKGDCWLEPPHDREFHSDDPQTEAIRDYIERTKPVNLTLKERHDIAKLLRELENI